MAAIEPTANAVPSSLSADDINTEFRQLLRDGFRLIISGKAKAKASSYLPRTRPPQHKIELFGVTFYLSELRFDKDGFKFFVAYLLLPQRLRSHRRRIYARIIYKDSSLIWRSPSHLILTPEEKWIGKGATKPSQENGQTLWYSAEETTNLPLEIDAALDAASRSGELPQDNEAMALILRNAPSHRIEPYADFSRPRQRAMADRRRRIYNNRDVGWFADETPESLQFAAGFEPDFRRGLIDSSQSRSRMFGGDIVKYRFVSSNRKVQYMMVHGPDQVWMIPPQAQDDELFSYGLRAIDAGIDDRACIPGYEFHYLEFEGDPDSLYSQIPPGFAGAASELDPDRADASPWNERLPVIQLFRRWLGDQS